jgi:hypothetical protein
MDKKNPTTEVNLKEQFKESDPLEELSRTLPAVFARREVPRLLGGIVSVGHLQNMDCEGKGPRNRYLLGRRVFYRREDFLEWMRSNMRSVSV